MNRENDTVFTCWKEVAAYMGKGVRTVQRWEKYAGLPVQRPNARDKGIIRVSKAELDCWMASRRAQIQAAGQEDEEPQRPISRELVAARGLRKANRQLIGDFKDSLRLLFAQCSELRTAVAEPIQQEDTDQNAA